jgi:hypothetical protein
MRFFIDLTTVPAYYKPIVEQGDICFVRQSFNLVVFAAAGVYIL